MNAISENGQVMLTFVYGLLGLVLLSPTLQLTQLAIQHDHNVLQAAKTAVMTWTLANYPGREVHHDTRLGEMVMPDKDIPTAQKGAGTQDGTVSIGRLPWKTLGTPPLSDAHGEPLWYTVSSRFRDNGTQKNVLHCQSLHQLTISAPTNTQPIITDDLAAVIIAPHRALAQQQRHSPAQQKQASQYIEPAQQAARYVSRKESYRHLQQGRVVKNGQVMMNDSVLPVECQLLQRALARRRARE